MDQSLLHTTMSNGDIDMNTSVNCGNRSVNMACLVMCMLCTTHRAKVTWAECVLVVNENIGLMPCCMFKQSCDAPLHFGTLLRGPICTTLTPCLMRPITTASIATLLPAVAKICPRFCLGSFIHRLCARNEVAARSCPCRVVPAKLIAFE